MSLKTNFTIIPNEYQQPVLESWSRFKLVRGKPHCGKTMLAALLALDVKARGDDTWYRSPHRSSVDKFVEFSQRLNPKISIRQTGNTISVGTRIWASNDISYPRGIYQPDLLILDDVGKVDGNTLEHYIYSQTRDHRDVVVMYEPTLHTDYEDHRLEFCEHLYVKSLLDKPDDLLMTVFDYSPSLPGGYVPKSFEWNYCSYCGALTNYEPHLQTCPNSTS